jgi:hypothetical protein
MCQRQFRTGPHRDVSGAGQACSPLSPPASRVHSLTFEGAQLYPPAHAPPPRFHLNMPALPKAPRVIGPADAGGTAYAPELAWFLTRQTLVQATVATAYLTEQGAERFLSFLTGRPPTRTRPEITLLVGSLQGFTRKNAIRACIRFANRYPRIRFKILHPDNEAFHLKAAHFSLRGSQTAVVGSHNLTSLGLASLGELGVVLKGPVAAPIRKSLDYWANNSTPWSTFLRRYRESARPVPTEPRPRSRSSDVPRGQPSISETASTGLASEQVSLTPGESAIIERVRRSLTPTLRRVATCWFWHDSAATAITDFGHLPGAYFDTFLNFDDKKDWFPGQHRGIVETLHVVAVDARRSVVVHRTKPLIRYRVTPDIRTVAKRLGVDSYPDPEAIREYITFLRRSGSNPRRRRLPSTR